MVTIWIITQSGMSSVVRYKPAKDKVNKEHKALVQNSDDPTDWLIIRARVKADLEQVEKVSGLDLNIATDPSADYAYRGLCRTADFQMYMAKEIENIDYDSHFKEVVQSRAPKVAGRYQGMMSMWTAMAKWQDYSPYGGTLRTATNADGYTYGNSGKWGSTGYAPKSAAESAKTFSGGSETYIGYGSYGSYGKSPKYHEPEDLSPFFAPSENTVSIADMAGLIKSLDGNPKHVPTDSVNDATDDGFELWVRAYDSMELQGTTLSNDEVDALVAEIAGEQG